MFQDDRQVLLVVPDIFHIICYQTLPSVMFQICIVDQGSTTLESPGIYKSFFQAWKDLESGLGHGKSRECGSL